MALTTHPPWIRGVLAASLIVTLCPLLAAQRFQLTREQSVRFDIPGFEPRLDWMIDEPPVIDKQSFRQLQSDDYAPDSVCVRFKPGLSPSQSRAALLSMDGTTLAWESRSVPGLYRVTLDEDREVFGTVQAYLDRSDTLYAEPSYRQHTGVTDPNDLAYNLGEMWGLSDLNWGTRAPRAWDEHRGDQGFVIAIIDSNVEVGHSDLIQNIWTNPGEINNNMIDDDNNGFIDDIFGWNMFKDHNNVTFGLSDHGTHVAGTVGARGNNAFGVVGMNWNCSLMILACENPSTGKLVNTYEGIEYAFMNGARVSNNSYGSNSFSQTTFDVILSGQAAGHVVVAAAGNDSTNNDSVPHYPSGYSLNNVISVAATNELGLLEATFSNYGATTVDLGAPGVNIKSTTKPINTFGVKQGTSMASPHVAGAFALVWSQHPQLTWPEVVDRMLWATVPETSLAGKCVTGGRLDVHRALGIWCDPNGGVLGVGSWLDPFGGIFAGLAIVSTPKYGVLNFKAGGVTVPVASLVLSQAITLRAPQGKVVLNTL